MIRIVKECNLATGKEWAVLHAKPVGGAMIGIDAPGWDDERYIAPALAAMRAELIRGGHEALEALEPTIAAAGGCYFAPLNEG